MNTFILILVVGVWMSQARNVEELIKQQPEVGVTNKIRAVPFNGKGSRIISGQTASRGQFPYQAAIFVDSFLYCSGALISSEWILTAAQCVDGQSVWEVYLGAQDLDAIEGGRQTIVSTVAVQHEDYSSTYHWHDIALIDLGTEVATTEYIQPVGLPSLSMVGETFESEPGNVTGWGATSDAFGVYSATLQYAEMTVVSSLVCTLDFGDRVISGTLCALGAEGQTPCYGDGGSPLVLGSLGSYTLIGIVSFHSADGCLTNQPTGFTRVTEYLDWIAANTNITIT